MDNLMQDLRYALRTLRRAPGFTLAAVLTLALGIGANSTVFSAANALLLKPAAGVAEPGRLARIYQGDHSPLGYAQYLAVREQRRAFAGVVGERHATLGMSVGGAAPERVSGLVVSGGYFAVLGVPAAAGRVLGAADDRAPGASPVVVLGHGFWVRRFGADPGVVGRTVRLSGHPYQVVGVAARGFEAAYPDRAPDVYAPLAELEPLTGMKREEIGGGLYATARLAPGVSREAAAAALGGVAARLTAERTDRPARPEPLRFRVDHARGMPAELRVPVIAGSILLLLVVGAVLLIGCANLANLLLARATARGREIGVRLALGAERGRVVRQLLAESLVLSLGGGALAFGLTFWTADLLLRFVPDDAGISLDLSPDWRVAVFTGAVAVGATLVFGLVPALRASRPDLMGVLRDEAGGLRPSRLRSALVVGQVALCTVLIGGAGLFLRSLGNARHLDPGFDARPVLDLPVDLSLRSYPEDRGRDFYRRLLESASALPGVRSASLGRVVPLGGSNMETRFELPGKGEAAGVHAYFNVVGPRYFATLGIPVVRGRDVSPSDRDVVVVNEALAKQVWPRGDALGRQIEYAGARRTVVGVVRDAKYVSLGEGPRPTLYLSFADGYGPEMTLHVRTAGDPGALRTALAAAAQSLDPALPLESPRPMLRDMDVSLVGARAAAAVLGVFGALAVLLAAVGIYGVVSFSVGRRTREIGIRMALGATADAVLRWVLGGSMRLVGIGLAIGLVLAVAVGRAASSLLYGVGPADPALLLGAPLVLGSVALLASWLPARIATRVDPMAALRRD
ncbi:MAG: permease [Gemmatimonadetes bacterium]|nr:permease [Gemmatimonadota bacterium]